MVTAVSNHLERVLPPCAIRDDAMLTTAAKNALAADAASLEGVEATAKKGDLTLTGTVQYLSQCLAVVGATWMARGVAMVVDEPEITG